ncbi:hypothetical protein HMI54_005276 [Coelomomyces lativittatus]|nr:hypothetical protein HMI54_005276 [Coelomomyces lativittatus]KAJ1506675.1 hypothetical protein HMI55_001074 [Coelomomyces lativittatus]
MDPLSLDDKLNFQLLEENLEMESPNLSDLESPITKPLADGFHSDSIHKGMTLKEQERIIDDLRKENYNLKMRIYFLEDTMNKMSPAYVNEAIKENVDLRTKLERSNAEKKQLVDQLQRLQTNSQSTSSQINNQLESHHQLQLNMFKSHIETLENQLMELREAKLHLEDKDLRQRESQLSTKNQAELALQQVDSLKIELQFIKDQSNRYKQELIDTQVQLTATEQKLNKLTKSRSSHLMENEDVENGENEQKGNLHSQCLEKMKHLKSHIQAQTLILSEREKQLIELQNQVSILTHELNSRDHLDVYQPPNASSRSQGQGQMGTSSALYIQLTELNRQANERAREATKLQSELNMQKDVLTKTVREIEAQFEKELQQLRHQVQESKDQYQRVHEKYVQLSAKHDAMVASHKDQNKNIKEAEKLWTVERQNYEDNLYRLNRSNIELKNEVIQKGKEIFSLQEEISSRVFKEQSVVDQMEAIQQKCHKVDANTQSTRFEMEGLEEELKKAHAKSEEVENAWRKETERRCQVEQRELARVAELDEFLRTERQVNKNLKVRLTSLEKDMEVLQQTHEREVNELQALARVGNEMDRLQTMDQFKSKLTALEKENKLYQEMLGKLKNALKGKVTELQTYKDRLSHVQATADNHYYRLTHLLQQRNLSTSFPSSSPTNPIDTPTTKTMATESDAAPDLTVKSPRRPTSLIEDHVVTLSVLLLRD